MSAEDTTTGSSPGPAAELFAHNERLMSEACSMVDSAAAAGATLRLVGGLAIRRHCTDLAFADREYGDIDMVGRRAHLRAIGETFSRLGFREDVHVAQATQLGQRQFLRTPGAPFLADHVDVFIDRLSMDHVIELAHRLDLDEYAISPADALIAKLQIFRLTHKDVHDVIALVKDVPMGRDDAPHVINIRRIAGLCAEDWGLYTDVESNIEKCRDALGSFALDDSDYDRVKSSLTALQMAMSGAAKTLRWRLRSRIGKRLAWHREVEETDRPVGLEDLWGMHR